MKTQNISPPANDYSLLLDNLLKNKPGDGGVVFQIIDILSEKIKALEEANQSLKKSLSELRTELTSPKTPEFLNCTQSCKLLQMSPQTLNQRRKEGRIKAFRIGKNYMYELADLLKLARPSKRH
jgi:hypothetical protein